MADKPNILVIMGDDIGITNETLKEYPQRQAASSYSPHDAYERLTAMHAGAK
jgi:hypothetical protein